MAERQSFYVGVKGLIQNQDGHVLILKDVTEGKWEVPGGKIDQGQSIEDAFSREVDEELPGAVVRRLGKVAYTAVGEFNADPDHKLLLLFHLAEVVLPDEIVLSEEHSDWAWVDPGDTAAFDLYATDRAAIASLAGS